MSCPGRDAPSVAHVTIDCDGHALRWLVNCDLIAIRISRTAGLRGWMVVGAGLASGTAELEPVGVPSDLDWVSVPGVAVLGVWDLEPGVAVVGV